MPVNSYKDLEVWKKSMDLVKLIYITSAKFPRQEEFGLSSQIRRASVSVSANIAEGWGRKTTGLFVQSLRIARGSLMELETETLIAAEINYLEDAEKERILVLISEISRMMHSLINKLENK